MKLLVMVDSVPVPETEMPPPWLLDSVDCVTVTVPPEEEMPPPWLLDSVDCVTVTVPPEEEMPPPWLLSTFERVRARVAVLPAGIEIPIPVGPLAPLISRSK